MTASAADSLEESCEQGQNGSESCKEELDEAIFQTNAKFGCSSTQLALAAAEESTLLGTSSLSLDGQNNDAFCDSTSGAMIGGDDAGFVPNDSNMLKCACGELKHAGKLVAAVIKCHDKMNGAFNGGDPTNSCSGGCATDSSTCAADDSGCVPDTKNHEKCSAAIVKACDKAISCVGKCHCKQASALLANKTFNEETCEGHNPPKNNACQDKLDGTISKLNSAGICSSTQLTVAGAEESTLFAAKSNPLSLDAQNGGTFCDSTSGSMIMASDSDDAGWVPTTKNMLKCECTVHKNETKLVHAVLICHVKLAHAFANGKAFDEEACEETGPSSALAKYNHARDVIIGKGVCPPCLDSAHQDALAASALSQLDTFNFIAYPCP